MKKPAITCRNVRGPNPEDGPKIIIEFSPDFHPENFHQIFLAVKKTIENKIACMAMSAMEESSHVCGSA